jgi:hypothetical protein
MTAGRKNSFTNTDWNTPQKYVDAVNEVFGGKICLDPCSNMWSIVNAEKEYIFPEYDGLKESWVFQNVFVNPPYGRNKDEKTSIYDWIKKCYETYDKYENDILLLIPVATNTKHWKNYIWGKASSICFLYDTRLRFLQNGKDDGKGAPMACSMIYYGNNIEKFVEVFSRFGWVITL